MAWHLPIYQNRDNDSQLTKIEEDIVRDFNNWKIKETDFQSIKNIDKTKTYIALNQLMWYSDFIKYREDISNDSEFIYSIEKEYDWMLCPIEIHIDKSKNRIINIYLIQ